MGDSTCIENIKIQYCIATNTLTMPRISTCPDAPNKSGFLQPARSKRTNDLPWLTRFPVTTSPADSAPDNKTGSGDTKNTHGRFERRRDKYVSAQCITLSPARAKSVRVRKEGRERAREREEQPMV
ncbi:hypothetical protein K0M31_000427 [Melipona bicolor]|uniref:Uncharacterized protein n=1 Tax=Melipona bicolor TaxID=60889 RepID=A0AA40GDR3_9HYME|nr:hypothetical protein K0M31_000427 [Melipona bicolor]